MDKGKVVLKKVITLENVHQGVHLCTDKILRGISLKKESGLLHLSLLNEGVSLSLNENCDPTVRSDLSRGMQELFGKEEEEGKGLIVGRALDLPISNGSPILGTWQGIYVCVWGKRKMNIRLNAWFITSNTKGEKIVFTAPSRGVHDISSLVSHSVAKYGEGVVSLLLQHTSASITMNSSSEKTSDEMEKEINILVPEKWNQMFFEHTYEGPDDMPAHMKSSLIGASLSIGIPTNGKIGLGKNQTIYLCEHRNTGGWGGGHSRKIALLFLSSSFSSLMKISIDVGVWIDISSQLDHFFSSLQKSEKKNGILKICSMSSSTIFLHSPKHHSRIAQQTLTKLPLPHSSSSLLSSLFSSCVSLEVVDGGILFGDLSVHVCDLSGKREKGEREKGEKEREVEFALFFFE